MELAEAFRNALYVLEEERVRPTLNYRYASEEWPHEMQLEAYTLKPKGYTPSMAAVTVLARLRAQRPREVWENPNLFVFESVNFNLLLTIMNQLEPGARAIFIAGLLKPMLAAAPTNDGQFTFPSWRRKTSSLALLAEFCIRTGYLQALLDATLELKMPSAGVAIMLMEIEEIISLNFNLFSRAQIDILPEALAYLREIAERQTWTTRQPRGGGQKVNNPHYREGFSNEGEEIVNAIDAIGQQCNQARYFYLKGALQQTMNLEVENDKTKVIGFLDSLGFDPLLTASLAKAESLYRASSDAFDLKSCLGHIRSFYEHLNIDAGQAIARDLKTTVVDEWDPTLTFLKNQSFLSPQQDKFARGLFTLLSDEGVHPLIAEREFARLLRNVVIEYGLMFLTMLQKKGITILASNGGRPRSPAQA